MFKIQGELILQQNSGVGVKPLFLLFQYSDSSFEGDL